MAPAILGFVKAAQQRRGDVAGFDVKIITGTIEVRRHRRNEVAAVLAPVGLAKLDAGDLGDRIGLVGGLERRSQQRILGNRLRRFARIDARGAEEHELLNLSAVRRVNDVGFDEQVVVEKIGGKGIVGIHAPNAPRREEDDARTLRSHPVLDLGLPPEIHHPATGIEQQVAGFRAAAGASRRLPPYRADRRPRPTCRQGRKASADLIASPCSAQIASIWAQSFAPDHR